MGQYVGLDLSLKETPISVMNGDGTVLCSAIAATDAEVVEQILTEHSPTPNRIVHQSNLAHRPIWPTYEQQ